MIIKEMKTSVSIHTIGFSEEHDAKLLSQLTLVGNVIGTLQFIELFDDIEQSIENIIQHMMLEKMLVGFISSNKQLGYIELNKDEDAGSFTGDLLIDSCDTDHCKLLIAKHKYDVNVVISPVIYHLTSC